MKMKLSLKTVVAASLILAASILSNVQAQPDKFPDGKPIFITVGYPAGGGLDLTTRVVAAEVSKILGVPVLVQNKPGANGMISIRSILSANADGHNLFADAPGVVMNPWLFSTIPYDPISDITPVSQMVAVPWVLVVNPQLPIRSLQDFITFTRNKGDRLTMANTGASLQLAGELIRQKADIQFTWIPYKGAGQAAPAVVTGEVDGMVTDTGTSLQLIKSGKLRALVVTSEVRSGQLPDVPTAKEAGLDLQAESWFGIFASSKTPQHIVDRLNAVFNQALRKPEVIQRLSQLDLRPVEKTPREFSDFYLSELTRWRDIVKKSQIKPAN